MDLSMVCTGSIPLSLADSTNLHDKIFHYSQLTAAVLFPISFILAPSAICVSSIYSQDDVIGSYWLYYVCALSSSWTYWYEPYF